METITTDHNGNVIIHNNGVSKLMDKREIERYRELLKAV